jgi:hypothetical protein
MTSLIRTEDSTGLYSYTYRETAVTQRVSLRQIERLLRNQGVFAPRAYL